MSAQHLLPTRADIERAARDVYAVMPPTPQIQWPLLSHRAGLDIWIKHENHTPIGAFKVRGGLHYMANLAALPSPPAGVVSATRGNHGQSVGLAARRHGLPATIVVPHGNSTEKNDAMGALGVRLIEAGEDFQAAREHANALAASEGLHMLPSFHRDLVAGVATYSMELLTALPDLDVLYVPVGLGSGICGAVAARAALGHRAEIVGVVSRQAPAYAWSFEQRSLVEAPVTTRIADGLACRRPDPEALEIILAQVARIVQVTDDEIRQAMILLYTCTHNVAEGAGAAGLAAIRQERDRLAGRKVAFTLSGANVDRAVFAPLLAG